MPFSVQSLQFAVRTYFAARTPQTIWIVPKDDTRVRSDTLQEMVR